MKNVKCWGLNFCIVTVTLNMWSVCPIHLLTSFAMFLPWKHVCIKWSVELDIQIIVSVSHLFCQFLHDSLLQTNRGQYNWTCWTNRSNAITQCALSTTYFKARTKDRGDQRGSPWNQNCWRTSSKLRNQTHDSLSVNMKHCNINKIMQDGLFLVR